MRFTFIAQLLCGTFLSAASAVAPPAAAGEAANSPAPDPSMKVASATEPVQATITDITSGSFQDGDGLSCAALGKVMVARHRRKYDWLYGTSYWCGTVMINGKQAWVGDEEQPGELYDETKVGYYSRGNRVLTLSKYNSANYRQVFHASSMVVGEHEEILNIRSETQWRKVPTFDTKMACPENMVMVGKNMTLDFLCATIWQGNPVPTSPGGVITFRLESNQPCSIPVPNGPRKEIVTHRLRARYSPCASDETSSIEFENLPSATRILLTDPDSCEKTTDDKSSFWIELLTINKSTTMTELNLDEFFGYSPGATVKPGVKLVNFGRYGSESASKKLSCVQITTSSAPPST